MDWNPKAYAVAGEAVDAQDQGSLDLDGLLKAEGAAHLKPVVSAIYGRESDSGANARTSIDGARGGMQIIPDTFKRFAKPGERIDNPVDNMRVGIRYIKAIGDQHGNDPARIAAGYFSGEGNVSKSGERPFVEDRKDGNGVLVSQYVSGVLKRMGGAAIPSAQAAEQKPSYPKWGEVSANPKFKALTAEQQDEIRKQYFVDNIAPQIDSGELPAVWAQFDQETRPAAPAKKGLFDGLLSEMKTDPNASFLDQATSAGKQVLQNLVPGFGGQPSSVMDGYKAPGQEVGSSKVIGMSESGYNKARSQMLAMDPDRLQRISAQGGVMGQVADQVLQERGVYADKVKAGQATQIDDLQMGGLPQAPADQQELADMVRELRKPTTEKRPEGVSEVFSNAVMRGLKNNSAMMSGLLAMGADSVGADPLAVRLLKENLRASTEAKNYPAAVQDFTHINGMSDVPTYTLEAIVENAPQLIGSIGMGVVGKKLATAFGQKAVAGMVAEQAAKELARRGVIGAAAGAGLASVGMETGSIYGDIFQETGERRPGTALGFGAVAGALDAIPAVRAATKLVGPVPVEEGLKAIIKKYGKDVALQTLEEGGTEFLQTWTEKAAVSSVDGRPLFTADNMVEAFDSMFKGAAAGGGTTAAIRGAQEAGRGVQAVRDKLDPQGAALRELNATVEGAQFDPAAADRYARAVLDPNTTDLSEIPPENPGFLPERQDRAGQKSAAPGQPQAETGGIGVEDTIPPATNPIADELAQLEGVQPEGVQNGQESQSTQAPVQDRADPSAPEGGAGSDAGGLPVGGPAQRDVAEGQEVSELEQRVRVAAGAPTARVVPVTSLPSARDSGSAPGLVSRETGSLASAIAWIGGHEAVFYTGGKDGASAFVDPKDRKRVFINADSNDATALHATTGHEIGHLIKRESPDAFQRFMGVVKSVSNIDIDSDAGLLAYAPEYWREAAPVVNQLRDAGKSDAEIVDTLLKQMGEGYDRDTLREEFYQDIFGNRFREKGFWQGVIKEMARTDIGLLQKFRQILDKIITAVGNHPGRGFGTDKFVEDLKAVRDAAARTYVEYAGRDGMRQKIAKMTPAELLLTRKSHPDGIVKDLAAAELKRREVEGAYAQAEAKKDAEREKIVADTKVAKGQTMEQVEAATRAQGFDETQPTAMAQAMAKAKQGEQARKSPQRQGDMFAKDFATKRSTVTKEVVVSSRGATEKVKLGNVNSAGMPIAPTKQALENFWTWYGDGPVDAKGRPVLLYHSTNADISKFESGRKTVNNYGLLGDVEVTRAGVFATPDREFSQEYLRRGEGQNVLPVYMALQNPFDIREGIAPEQERQLVDAGISSRWLYDFRGQDWEMFDNADDGSNDFVDTLKSLGYDGAIINEAGQDGESHETYVAFRPEQIKSAIGNRGNFSAGNPDIRYSKQREGAPRGNEDKQARQAVPAEGRGAQSEPGSAAADRQVPRYGKAREGAVAVLATHYSREQRQVLDSAYYGTGIKGEEGNRVFEAADQRLRRRTYFYVDEGNGVKPEAGVGAYAHQVELANLYDVKADPLKFRRYLGRDPNAMETAILDAGFDGYYAPEIFTTQGVAVLLGKHTVPVAQGNDRAAGAAPKKAAADPLQEFTTLRSLPFGQATGPEWVRYLDAVAPGLSAKLGDFKAWLAGQKEPALRDQLVQRFEAAGVQFSKQRAVTETPAFKRWFGDSKVVDENGRPLVVYHGTDGAFSVFKDRNARSAYFFAFDPEEAGRFAEGAEENNSTDGQQNVMPAYLRAENIFDARRADHRAAVGFKYRPGSSFSYSDLERLIPRMKAAGFDGMYDAEYLPELTPESEFSAVAVFNPAQIKSAIGNNGDFDPANPDIRFSKQRTPGSDIGHKRTKAGDYVGAPAGMTPAKLGALRTRLEALAKEGERGRFWYEESSHAILQAAEGDMALAEKIAGLLAIYSPQATVSANTSMGLKALYQWQAGEPIKVRFKHQDVKAQAWMDGTMGEEEALQIKTGNFFKNLMRKIDESRYGYEQQGATIDMWMARVFGYGTKAVGSSARYYFAERETKRLADKLGWEPQQVQAALWVSIKSRIEAIADQARELGKKKGWLERKVVTTGGKENISWPPKPEHREDYEGLILKMALATEPDPSGLTSAAYNFGTAIQERIGQVSWEAKPGATTKILPGIFTAPLAQQAEYLDAIDRALRDENGQDLIAKKLGLPVLQTAMGPSAWQMDVGAGAQTVVAMATERDQGNKKVTVSAPARKLLKTYAAIRGLVLAQEAVVWHYPLYDSSKKNANGIELDFGRDPTHDEVVSLYNTIHEVSGREDWAPAFVPGVGVRILNFSDVPNTEFHKLVLAAADRLEADVEAKTFQSDGDYISNDWVANADGAEYKEIINASEKSVPRGAQRSDLQGWVEGVLRPRVERVNQDFARRYGWGAATLAERDEGQAQQVLKSAQRSQTETPEFKRWSKGAPLIQLGQEHTFSAGERVVVQALHGTTADFSAFNRAYANIESDLGGGFYFTNNPDDVGSNYAGLGPDLTSKVELAAERLESDSGGELDMDEARRIARERYMAHDGMTMPVYVRFDNPVVLGGPDETFLDIDEETEEYGEPTGKLVDIVTALREEAADGRYGDLDIEKAIGELWEPAMDGGGLPASTVIDILTQSEGLAYSQDYEADNSPLASKEIIRKAFEAAGFDGFIDQTVSQKFGSEKRVGQPMEGMDPNTVHFIAFEPTQVKSAIGNNGAFDPSNPDIRYSPQRRLIQRIDAAIDGLSNLPDQFDYLKDRYRALGKIARVDEITAEIKDAFKSVGSGDKQAVYTYLTDRNASPNIIGPADLRSMAQRIKRTINYVGDQLVARGLLDPAARAHYRDQYLPRLYLKHLLSEQEWRILGAGKKPSDLGYLKHRKEIAPEVRELILGEVKDPAFLSANAIGRSMRDIALLDWLATISQKQEWVFPGVMVNFRGQNVTAYWLKAEAERIENQLKHYTPQNQARAQQLVTQMRQTAQAALGNLDIDHKMFRQIPDTNRYGLLRGMWVRKEIYQDIMGLNGVVNADPTWFEQFFGIGHIGTKLTQYWKFSKVAANPPGQIRNFVSNMVMLQLSGVGLHKLPIRLVQAARDIVNNGPYWQAAKKYGVTESTFTAQELYKIKRDLVELEAQMSRMNPLTWLKAAGIKLLDGMGTAYQFAEALGKTIKVMDEMKKGKSEAEAAIEAQKWLFDYSLVPQWVRVARNSPVGMPFITYQVKVLPRLLEVATTAPWRFLPWMAVLYGMQYYVSNLFGVSPDDLDKLKKSLPEWLQDRGHTVVLPFKDDEGRVQVADVGYFFPWTWFSTTGKHVAEGKMGKVLKDDIMGQFSAPIIGATSNLLTNYDSFTKRPIYNEADPVSYQAGAIANYLYDLAVPPIISSHGVASPMGFVDKQYGGKAWQAASGTTNKFGDPKATMPQAAAAAVGVNFYGMDPDHTRVQNMQALMGKINDAEKALKRRLMDQGLTAEQRRKAVADYQGRMQELAEEAKKYAAESEVPEQLKAGRK